MACGRRARLLNLFHGVARTEQIRPRGDDLLTRSESVEHRHLIADERAGADVDGFRDGSSVLLLHAVHEVLVSSGIVDERIDWDAKLTAVARLARDADRRNHSRSQRQ